MAREAGLPSAPPPDIAEQAKEFFGRQWVGDRIAEWLANRAAVLLITGEPGAGKTLVAAQAVAVARGEARLGALAPEFLNAAHFCRQSTTESIDPLSILEKVSDQLAATVPGYFENLTHLASRGSVNIAVGNVQQQVQHAHNSTVVGVQIRIENPDPRLAYDWLFRRPLQRLHEEGRLTREVVVLIDGLDETVEGAAGTPFTARLAQELTQQVPSLRFCLTSRPGRAADHLGEIAATSGGHQRIDLTTDQPAGVDDVYRYVEHALRSLPSGRSDPALARRIAGAANGNFLYAHFLIDDAQQNPPVDERPLLPMGLADTYAQYLDRELSLDDASWEQRYRPILGALVQSREDGLTGRHLGRITGLPEPVIDDVLRVCRPYLQHAPDTEAFRPYHESFREYLRGRGRHYIYPDHATQAIVTALCALWRDRWLECDDIYILRNLDGHLRDLVQFGDERSIALADEMRRTVIDDSGFREASRRVAGKDRLFIDQERIELERIGYTIKRSAGQAIFLEGEQTDFAMLIKKGYVKVQTGNPPRVVDLRGPGEMVGEVAAIRGDQRTASVVALDEVEALYLSAAEWLNFLKAHPTVMLALLAEIDRRMQQVMRKVENSTLPIERRVATALLELAPALGQQTSRGTALRLSQRDLVDMTGAARDSITRVIRQFRAGGVIETGRERIVILDQDMLSDIASGDRSTWLWAVGAHP